jgi:hypothetical protein
MNVCMNVDYQSGVVYRRHKAVKRRTYTSRGPHDVWHIDGTHKLKPLVGLVVHGGVDGFSRACTFLRCSDNNDAATVLDAFKEGVDEYKTLPYRGRIDKGGENVQLAEYMIANRGTGRGSILTGRSVHNQRIERFWRDVNKDVLFPYHDIFK